MVHGECLVTLSSVTTKLEGALQHLDCARVHTHTRTAQRMWWSEDSFGADSPVSVFHLPVEVLGLQTQVPAAFFFSFYVGSRALSTGLPENGAMLSDAAHTCQGKSPELSPELCSMLTSPAWDPRDTVFTPVCTPQCHTTQLSLCSGCSRQVSFSLLLNGIPSKAVAVPL